MKCVSSDSAAESQQYLVETFSADALPAKDGFPGAGAMHLASMQASLTHLVYGVSRVAPPATPTPRATWNVLVRLDVQLAALQWMSTPVLLTSERTQAATYRETRSADAIVKIRYATDFIPCDKLWLKKKKQSFI
jgi:hypothetical protein